MKTAVYEAQQVFVPRTSPGSLCGELHFPLLPAKHQVQVWLDPDMTLRQRYPQPHTVFDHPGNIERYLPRASAPEHKLPSITMHCHCTVLLVELEIYRLSSRPTAVHLLQIAGKDELGSYRNIAINWQPLGAFAPGACHSLCMLVSCPPVIGPKLADPQPVQRYRIPITTPGHFSGGVQHPTDRQPWPA